MRLTYAIDITWNVCTYLVKLSIILLLSRRFPDSATLRLRFALHSTHLLLLFWTIAGLFSAVFRCTPVKRSWDPEVKGNCLHARAGRLVPAAFNLITNSILLGLSVLSVWHTHQQKPAVLGIFAFGLFCLVTSGVRLHYAVVVSSHGYDPTCQHFPLSSLASAHTSLKIE